MPHALVVYNPAAGTAVDPDLWLGTVIHRACEKYTVTVFPTLSGMDPKEILNAIQDDIDLILAAGGDGTIRFVLSALAETKSQTPVGLLPLGTGNQLARNLGIYEENLFVDQLTESIDIALSGDIAKLDLGLMNGQYFCVAAGAGPISDAILAPISQDKATWKMLAYASSMIQSIALPPVVFKITLPEETFRVPASGIFVTNIADLGVGTLSESAEVNDGLLDLCILNPLEFADYVHLGFRFGGGFVGGKAPYYVRKVKSLKIEVAHIRGRLSGLQGLRHKVSSLFKSSTPEPPQETPSKVIAALDGDACGTTPMQIDVVPHAVNVIVPKRSWA
jgi:diacylglycerol kinase (ATP)